MLSRKPCPPSSRHNARVALFMDIDADSDLLVHGFGKQLLKIICGPFVHDILLVCLQFDDLGVRLNKAA